MRLMIYKRVVATVQVFEGLCYCEEGANLACNVDVNECPNLVEPGEDNLVEKWLVEERSAGRGLDVCESAIACVQMSRAL
jgi:hypothetical protein